MAKIMCKNCGVTFYYDIMEVPSMRRGQDNDIKCPDCGSKWIDYIEPGQPTES